MLAKLAQIGPESGARHLWKPAGMLAKLAQAGPESGARHLWKRVAKAAGAKKEGRGDAFHPFVPPKMGAPDGEVHSAPPIQLKK